MLMLSKKVEYALMALLHMDREERGLVVSSKELAETYGLPVDLMGKVMQSLARHGFIEAIHGAKGGYRARRVLDDITLGEVIEAIEGPVHLVKCQVEPAECDRYAGCSMRDPIRHIQSRIKTFFHGITLAALRQDSVGVAIHE